MTNLIKVYTQGRHGEEIKEVSREEAGRMVAMVYADPMGGLVADKRTGEVIWEVGSDVEEIFLIDQMVGGG